MFRRLVQYGNRYGCSYVSILRCVRIGYIWMTVLAISVGIGGLNQSCDAADDSPTVEQITADLMTRDIYRIRRTLKVTTVRVLSDRSGRKQFILDLWREQRSKYPDLPWDIILAPQVRVHLANILVPVAQTGRDRLSPDDILDYAWNAAESPDEEVVHAALDVIARFDEPRIVQRIERYLSEKTRGSYAGYYGAVWALAQMCNDDASRLLDKIESQEVSRERVEIIADARQQWEELKKESGYCNR